MRFPNGETIMRTATFIGAAAAALAWAMPAAAVTTTLDFSGNICGVAGDQACGNGSQIGQNYGDSSLVDVSYRSGVAATGATFEPYLKWWTTYGDLNAVVWGGSGPTGQFSEITFTPTAGYEISLIGFDGACYLNRATCQTFPYSVTAGATTLASGNIVPPAGGHDSVLLNTAYQTGAIVLRWGPDGYDGGLDNIRFDVRSIANGAVPEPATWAMMIGGIGLAGGALRRRRGTPALA